MVNIVAETVVNLLQQWLDQNQIKTGSKTPEETEEVEVFQMMDGKLETIRYPKRSWVSKFRRQIKRVNPTKWKIFGPKVQKSYSWTLNPGVDPTV